ncbi:MAG TPA: hypothetical protein VNH15_03915 [Elusimicrobiota bacterium]|nr:hypothetical protein [Elusimicrobiota bacterium]
MIKLQEKKEKVQTGELEKMRKQTAAANAAAAAAKRRERETRAKAKQGKEAARKQGVLDERSKKDIRTKRLMARLKKSDEANKKLKEEREMWQKHTSPQEIGLADEGVLVKRLEKEFPGDRIEHTGTGGDVLHHAIFDGDEAGCIVYECKHTDRIETGHITQTALAKKTRQASYGILVTTGTRKGFSGLDQEAGIFLVAQAGVLTLARICRDSLVTMARQRLDASAKAAAAKRLMDYVTSPVCKTPLEEAISHTERAHKNLVREVKQHLHDWKERHELYLTIHYDVSHVQKNLNLVLGGKEPLKLEKPRFEPLALPFKND